MAKNCKIYFEKGVEASSAAGYLPQNWAACNIKRIQKGISAPGLGKPGGKRSTRRGKRSAKRSTRRN